MPGGKKHKSKHRNTTQQSDGYNVRFKREDELYGVVLKPLGCSRFMVKCEDGFERIAKLRGNFRRSEWVTIHTVILLSLRNDATNKTDILHKYSEQDVKMLKKYGELDWMHDTRPSSDEEFEENIVFSDDAADISAI
jgi:translation initiation factor 1A